MRTLFNVAPRFGMYPTHFYEDTDEIWDALLNPDNITVTPDKSSSPCIRTAHFLDVNDPALVVQESGTPSPCDANVDFICGALYDLDFWPDGNPLMLEEVLAALGPYRAVIWTSYHHMASVKGKGGVRYKLYIPYAVPIPGDLHRAFYAEEVWKLFKGLRGLDTATQKDLVRIAFYGTVHPSAPQHYRYKIKRGDVLNPVEACPEPPENIHLSYVGKYVQSSENAKIHRDFVKEMEEDKEGRFYSDAEMYDMAYTYFTSAAGSIQTNTRHTHLWRWAMRMFWEFVLNIEQVEKILLKVNSLFPEPKQIKEVYPPISQAYKRVFGGDRGTGAICQPSELGCKRKKPGAPVKSEIKDRLNSLKKQKKFEEYEFLKEHLLPAKDQKPILNVNSLQKLTKQVGLLFYDKAPVGLISLLSPYINQVSGESPIPLPEEHLKQILLQASLEVKQKKAEEHARELREREKSVYALRGEKGHYTEEEMAAWANLHGKKSAKELESQLVIRHGSTYWAFVNGDYKYHVNHPASNGALSRKFFVQNLAPYERFSADKMEIGVSSPKTQIELEDDYVTLVDKVEMDLAAPYGHIKREGNRSTLVMNPLSLNPYVEPFFSREVDAWLKTTSNYDDFVTWLSWLLDFREPLYALYLQGEGSTGKTTFCEALSKLFVTNPGGYLLGMEEAIDRFSQKWLENPIFVADEGLPKAVQKDAQQFRRLITRNGREVEPKGRPKMSVRGYFRFIIAGNNDKLLPTDHEILNEHDVAAMSRRVLHVELTPKTRALTKAMGNDWGERLKKENIVANHVLWLNEARKHKNTRASGTFPFEITKQSPALNNIGVNQKRAIFIYRTFEILNIFLDELKRTEGEMPPPRMPLNTGNEPTIPPTHSFVVLYRGVRTNNLFLGILKNNFTQVMKGLLSVEKKNLDPKEINEQIAFIREDTRCLRPKIEGRAANVTLLSIDKLLKTAEACEIDTYDTREKLQAIQENTECEGLDVNRIFLCHK